MSCTVQQSFHTKKCCGLLMILVRGYIWSNTETVMTYDQWKRLYRKNIKKMIRDTVTSGICWLVISGMTLMIPVGMFAHWLLVGY